MHHKNGIRATKETSTLLKKRMEYSHGFIEVFVPNSFSKVC